MGVRVGLRGPPPLITRIGRNAGASNPPPGLRAAGQGPCTANDPRPVGPWVTEPLLENGRLPSQPGESGQARKGAT